MNDSRGGSQVADARRERKQEYRKTGILAAKTSSIDECQFEDYVIDDNPQLRARAAMSFQGRAPASVPYPAPYPTPYPAPYPALYSFQAPQPLYPVDSYGRVVGGLFQQYELPSFYSQTSALQPRAMNNQQVQDSHSFGNHCQPFGMQGSLVATRDTVSENRPPGAPSALGGFVAQNSLMGQIFPTNVSAPGMYTPRKFASGNTNIGGRVPGSWPESGKNYSWTNASSFTEFLEHRRSSPSKIFATSNIFSQRNLPSCPPAYLPPSVASSGRVASYNVPVFGAPKPSTTGPLVYSPTADSSDSVRESSAQSVRTWNLEQSGTTASRRVIPPGSPLGGKLKETPLGVKLLDKNSMDYSQPNINTY